MPSLFVELTLSILQAYQHVGTFVQMQSTEMIFSSVTMQLY